MKGNIAIITARGGSKRIPRKNIKHFCGKPIIAYSIEAALTSDLFEEVMVSTDDAEIAAIAKQYGAEVPFYRSTGNSDDYASTADVIKEVIGEYEKRGRSFEVVCCIYPTAPFITGEKLRNAYHTLGKTVDAVIPVTRFSYPPQRAFIFTDQKLQYKWPEYEKKRSQDLEPFYHDAGQFYFMKTDAFKAQNSLITKQIAPLIIPDIEVQDIDNEEDWQIAELKYQYMMRSTLQDTLTKTTEHSGGGVS